MFIFPLPSDLFPDVEPFLDKYTCQELFSMTARVFVDEVSSLSFMPGSVLFPAGGGGRRMKETDQLSPCGVCFTLFHRELRGILRSASVKLESKKFIHQLHCPSLALRCL